MPKLGFIGLLYCIEIMAIDVGAEKIATFSVEWCSSVHVELFCTSLSWCIVHSRLDCHKNLAALTAFLQERRGANLQQSTL